MDAQVKQRWVEALRSGKYQQARSTLRNDTGYCCLGVLCDLAAPERWYGNHHNGNRAIPTFEILNGVNLDHDSASALAAMNDDGASFADIADYIEKEL